jgi:hypothetical protein
MAMASVIGPIINNRDRLSPAAIGIDAEQHATDRPHEKADAERGGREQQRGILAFCWEKQARDVTVKNPKTMKSYHSSALPITAATI